MTEIHWIHVRNYQRIKTKSFENIERVNKVMTLLGDQRHII